MNTLNKKITSVLVLFISLFIFSCEGFHEEIVPINIDVENIAPILVINGEIEEDTFAFVQISYSEDIDASIITPQVYEENATIVLSSSDGLSETLQYWKYGLYYGQSIKGEVNKTYTMTISIAGETYSASSTMLAPRGFQSAWVTQVEYAGKEGIAVGYSDEWIINDPSNQRNRYLFQWWRNGVHEVIRDWSIDDNRVVNANEGLRLFNVTTDPNANEHTRFRVAEIDKLTYDYYNMYERIVRKIVSVASQTPYNPVSNFGKGTIGNFRAVSFSSAVVLTPPSITAKGQSQLSKISFELNSFFTEYNLYWSTTSGVTKSSNLISDIQYTAVGTKNAYYQHKNLSAGTYYYRIEVKDSEGNISILSPEVSAAVY